MPPLPNKADYVSRVVLPVILAVGLFSITAPNAWAQSDHAKPDVPSTISKVATGEHPAASAATPAAKHPAPKAKKHATAKKTDSKGPAKGSSPFSELAIGQGKGPVSVTSDKLSLDYKGNTVVFTGHVRALQTGGGQLTCDNLKVAYGKQFRDITEMIADGNVRLSEGTRWVTGDHAVMNQVTHTVVMTGSPVVHDGNDQITGSKITVHLDTGKSVVENAHAVIFPKQSQRTDNVAAGNP